MNCNAAPMWRFLCAKQFGKKMFNYWWPKTTTRWALGVGRWALGVGRDALGVGRDALCVKVPEKSAWTDLDRVDFEKKSSMSKCSNRKIGVDRSREK